MTNIQTTLYYWYNGKQYTVKQLAELAGMTYDRMYQRIMVQKWGVKESVETPIKRRCFRTVIENYLDIMEKYYTKEHRKKCYAQLKKDFEELQQHLKVA